jgi:hypothetical protein
MRTVPERLLVFGGPLGSQPTALICMWRTQFNNEIRKIVIASGVVTTLAGSTTSGNADGTGTAASFFGPCRGSQPTALICMLRTTSEIRKIVIASGVVTTLAGSTTTHGNADGTGTAVSFYNLFGITTDGTNLYVVDTLNNDIRKIVIASGVVTTLAGSTTPGNADGTGTAASFSLSQLGSQPMALICMWRTGQNQEIREIQ